MRRAGLLDLNEAVQHPGRKLEFELETDLGEEPDVDLVESVKGTLCAVSTGNVLLLTGTFRTACFLECARCSEPIRVDLEITMADEFDVKGVPSAYAADGYAEVVADEPAPLFDHNAVVLDSYIRQGLWTNLPDQALCPAGWDGYCPNAGAAAPSNDSEGHPALRKLGEIMKGEKA